MNLIVARLIPALVIVAIAFAAYRVLTSERIKLDKTRVTFLVVLGVAALIALFLALAGSTY